MTIARSKITLLALLALLTSLAAPATAQIWSTDRTQEAADARAREERERQARGRGETVQPRPRDDGTMPSRRDGEAPRGAAPESRGPTPTAPNTSFTTPPSSAAPPGAPPASPPAPGARTAAPPPQGLPSRVEPRDFGLTLGDVIVQRVALPNGTEAFAQLDADLRSGRIGTWLERRGARRETDAQGQAWLVIEHQVVNVARIPRQGELPAQRVALQGGGHLDIAPAVLGLAPVAGIGANVRDVMQALRPDHAPPLPDAGVAAQRLRTSATALAAVLLSWLAWWRWREWRDARSRPFAQALRTLARTPHGAPEAWVAMHHALNAAAGRTVHAASIDALLERAPALLDERENLEHFFAASNARFFAPQGADATPFDLLCLATRLRRIERRS
jgi:mxaA protein